jgi:hypothetical protein
LSNGHGEDRIAANVAIELQHLGFEIVALPIVGVGQAYRSLGMEIVGPIQTMPSGGFIYMDWRQFGRDLKEGLGRLAWQQWQAVRQWSVKVDLVLAVGDIVVLLLARLSGAPFAFIGTAKSDYYLRDEAGPYLPWTRWWEGCMQSWRLPQPRTSVYLPWERWLMSAARCRAVFPRDRLTADNLTRFHLPVFDLGNPMMDGLESSGELEGILSDAPALLLLPGSRPPEAYRNWQQLLEVVRLLPSHLIVYAAIAVGLDRKILQQAIPDGLAIAFFSNQLGSCIRRATVVLAMTGTATEQCVGLGKPVVTLPGQGPQFTAAFAEAQARHLGPNIYRTTNGPAAAALQIQSLIEQPLPSELDNEWLDNGLKRMGLPGASGRIAQQLQQILSPSLQRFS